MNSMPSLLSNESTIPDEPLFPFIPPPVQRIEDTGLSNLWLQDLILKILYFQGYLNGFRIAEEIALPFGGIVDQLLENLKKDKLVEVKPAQQIGLGEGGYIYSITGLGLQRAQEALVRSQYVGPAPLPIQEYNQAILAQSRERINVEGRDLRDVFSESVLSDQLSKHIGPAVNSGTSIFLYGSPGNGKTSIARATGNLSPNQSMFIPYSVSIEGQVVKIYDSVNHNMKQEPDMTPQMIDRAAPAYFVEL